MITELEKHLFIGAKKDLDSFFERAQEMGIVEFTDHRRRPRKLEYTPQTQCLINAKKVLGRVHQEELWHGNFSADKAYEVAAEICKHSEKIEALTEEKQALDTELMRIAPFGDFSMQTLRDIEQHSNLNFHFFCVPAGKKIEESDNIFFIGNEFDLDYYICINKSGLNVVGAIEMRLDHSLGELKVKQQHFGKEISRLQQRIKELAIYRELIHRALLKRLDYYHLEAAKKLSSHPLEDRLFAVEGWVPVTKVGVLRGLTHKMAVHCEAIAPEKGEVVPTFMENKGNARIGEDLVQIYDTPSTTDKDPSSWVLWSFVLFFSMIIADGGYGFVYLALSLFLHYKFPKVGPSGKRLKKLLTLLAIGCITWGTLTCAFFGFEVEPDSKLGKLSIVTRLIDKKAAYHMQKKDDVFNQWAKEFPAIKKSKTPRDMLRTAVRKIDGREHYVMEKEFDQNTLLELSILIGSIHVSLGLMRYLRRNWAGIGWIAFIIGGYLYFPSTLNATSMLHYLGIIEKSAAHEVGIQLIYFGMGSACILSLIQNRLKGLGEIANVLGVFADVLSYLRLYALGLAGALMADTFNHLGSGVGFFVGFLIILLGHTVNITLATMSGVIHGLRLNFLEWYHWCFEGGGRNFNPLRKLSHKKKE